MRQRIRYDHEAIERTKDRLEAIRWRKRMTKKQLNEKFHQNNIDEIKRLESHCNMLCDKLRGNQKIIDYSVWLNIILTVASIAGIFLW